MADQTFQPGSCYEASLCEAAAIAQGSAFNQRAAVVPWGALMQRDLSVGVPSAGGYLAGSKTTAAVDGLRPYSLAARLGCTFIENQVQDLMVPDVTANATGMWLADETSSITVNAPVIGVTTCKPKTAGAVIRGSFQFMKQAGQSEQFIRAQLLGAMGDLLDEALFQGTGLNGQPQGLATLPGVNETTGSFDYQAALAMESAVSAAVGDDSNLAFAMDPMMRGLLKQTPMLSTSVVNEHGLVLRPVFVSKNVATNHIYLGDWKHAQITLWGSGIQLEVDPYTSFKTGAVQFRALMFADIQFVKTSAFMRYFQI